MTVDGTRPEVIEEVMRTEIVRDGCQAQGGKEIAPTDRPLRPGVRHDRHVARAGL